MARKLFFVSLALLLASLPVYAFPAKGSPPGRYHSGHAASSPRKDRTFLQQVESVRIAREAGPGALRELLDSLSGEARELALLELHGAERAAFPAPGLVDATTAARVGVNGACAFSTIREAIKTAPPGAVVRISAGVYAESIDLDNKILTLEGGYDVTCTVAGMGTSRIDGSARAGSTIDIQGGTVLLKNLEVCGGSSFGGGIDVVPLGVTQVTLDNVAVRQNNGILGGGMYVGVDTTVNSKNGSLIAENSAATYGGGVAVFGTFNSNATASAITGNRAAYGGGLAVFGKSGRPALDGTQIINNQATSMGGGIYIGDGANITLQNAVSIGRTGTGGNTAVDGGGIYLDSSAVKILGSVSISNNTAANNGGGIYLVRSALTVDSSAISANTAGRSGGGIYTGDGSAVTVQNGASIDHNTATGSDGGGIALGGEGTVVIHDATLQYNTAGQRGGAAAAENGFLDFNGSFTLRFNHAGSQGGAVAVYDKGGVSFTATGAADSLVTDNTAGGSGGAIYIGNNNRISLEATAGRALRIAANSAAGNGGAAAAENSGWIDLLGQIISTENSASGNGGLFYLAGGSQLRIRSSASRRPQVWGNTAQNGGAVYASGGSQVALESVDIGVSGSGNRAMADGGAIYADGSVITATNTAFQNNTAAAQGGAIAAFDHTNLTVQAVYPPATGACAPASGQCSCLHHNQAAAGGAIYADSSALAVQYTYLHHNSAVGGGGAIFQTGAASGSYVNNLVYANITAQPGGAGITLDGGTAAVAQVTAADNTGGAGIWAGQGNYTITNSIFWGNTSPSANAASTSCSIDQFSVLGAPLNPQFTGAGDYHLKSTAPAIDACPTGPALDLDNIPRPSGLRFDMGAYEAGNILFLPRIHR